MADTSSDFPTAIDPQPVALVDNIDAVPANALAFAISQAIAIQAEIGSDPVDFTTNGGPDYGTVGAFLIACSRIELGQTTTADTKGGFRVALTANRFTEPPFIFLQLVNTGASQRAHFHAKRITKDGFTIGTGHTTRTAAAGKVIDWIAIQPPFGIERTTEEDEN